MDTNNLRKQFEEYLLIRLGVSKNTLKFYRSDLKHFESWFLLRLRSLGLFANSLEETLPYLNSDEAARYKTYLEENQIPVKTINRRLSTLRQFSRFLVEQNLIPASFMEGITNSGIVIKKNKAEDNLTNLFEKYLRQEKVSQNTIKNYLSDIHHFLSWLDQQNI